MEYRLPTLEDREALQEKQLLTSWSHSTRERSSRCRRYSMSARGSIPTPSPSSQSSSKAMRLAFSKLIAIGIQTVRPMRPRCGSSPISSWDGPKVSSALVVSDACTTRYRGNAILPYNANAANKCKLY